MAVPGDDFFGAGYLGYDPYHQAASDKLDRLSKIDGLVRGDQAAAAGAQQQQQAPGRFSPQTGMSTYSMNTGFVPPAYGMSPEAQAQRDRGGAMQGQTFSPSRKEDDPPDPGKGTEDPTPPYPTPGGPTDCTGVPKPTSLPCPSGHWVCQGGGWVCNAGEPGPDNPSSPTPGPGGGGSGPSPGPYGAFGNWQPGGTGTLPPDLAALRGGISSLMQNVLGRTGGNPTAYGGPLSVGTEGLQQPKDMAWGIPGQVQNYMAPAQGAMNAQFGDPQGIAAMGQGAVQQGLGFANQGANWMSAFGGQAAGTLGAGNAQAAQIAQTGGLPELQTGLNAIQQNAALQIAQNSAQLREQYGKMGLGAGTDVSEAIARGASQGYAQMAQNQSQYLTNSILQAQQNRLGGVQALQAGGSALGGLGTTGAGTFGQLGGLASGAYGTGGQLAQGLGNLRLGAASNIAQQANTYGGVTNDATRNLLSANALDIQTQQANQQAAYSEFQRMQAPSPWMNSALGYATNYPPQQQQVPGTGSQLASAAITGGTGLLSAWLLASALSDKAAKERVVKARPVLPRLRKLPIYEWQYKGNSTRHIGPMAQDMHELFGTGDGKSIHLVDVMGIVLSAAKEMSRRRHA